MKVTVLKRADFGSRKPSLLARLMPSDQTKIILLLGVVIGILLRSAVA